jgi:trans-aconitate methyltransferase
MIEFSRTGWPGNCCLVFPRAVVDPVHALYQRRAYPAMSHPSTDPAVTAVAARLGGLDVANPARASVLEIGCAAGHNLLPLAARWPDSRFTGIDFSSPAILEARETARCAGLPHVEFIETDLTTFDPGDEVRYDFIIVHGVYSWVPEEVRQALLKFCARRLSAAGCVVISYNTLPGWSLRKTLVDLTSDIAASPAAGAIGNSPEEILGYLATATGNRTPYARHLTAVLHDLFGKGEEMLPFDDFSPVNEPCTFQQFTHGASRHGLHYLGESQLTENFPSSLAPEAAGLLKPFVGDPLVLQQTIDVLTNRTFRSALLCRSDAVLLGNISADALFQFSVRTPHEVEQEADQVCIVSPGGEVLARFDRPLAIAFFSALSKPKPHARLVRELFDQLASADEKKPELSRLIIDSAGKGLVLLHDGILRFNSEIPDFPNLGRLRLIAAAKGQALVDVYHRPHRLEEGQRKIAALMDGSRSFAELEALAKSNLPHLDFSWWMGRLAARGMFEESIG